jgi:hypothetical protein
MNNLKNVMAGQMNDKLRSTLLKFRKGFNWHVSNKVWIIADDKVNDPIFLQTENRVKNNIRL